MVLKQGFLRCVVNLPGLVKMVMRFKRKGLACSYKKIPSHAQNGFSLLEISIALAILGVLTYGLANTTHTGRNFDQYAQNRLVLDDIKLALLTFVQVNGYLPCPDSDADGRENRATAGNFQCTVSKGRLPYLELGVAPTDAWQQPFYYAVNHVADNDAATINSVAESASYFSNQGGNDPVFGFNTPPFGSKTGTGNYTVCAQTAAACNGSTAGGDTVEQVAIAVVISFGVNGQETWSGATLNTFETENIDNDNYFWVAADNNASLFDDQLIWLTGYELKHAIIRTGRFLSDLES
ncbi:type II secretion system protein [Thiomicrorhabdus aquaedulcis]|uniref:type II secretion system protein n=1 Tax=Thiomicrorhabdus aquaedulcis TaxID=2211106 RepID=UPI000FDC539F|nr:type II secretion system protein [Thiomicrorhabdus aquaedulcis]